MIQPHPPFIGKRRFESVFPVDRVSMPDIPPGYLERQHLAYQSLMNFRLLSLPHSGGANPEGASGVFQHDRRTG